MPHTCCRYLLGVEVSQAPRSSDMVAKYHLVLQLCLAAAAFLLAKALPAMLDLAGMPMLMPESPATADAAAGPDQQGGLGLPVLSLPWPLRACQPGTELLCGLGTCSTPGKTHLAWHIQ